MGRGQGPMKGRPHVGPPGEDRPPFNMGPPEWGPPPPRGWGPPPPGGWGPPPPGGWGPAPPEEWGPPHTAGWGPPPPGGWGLRGPPPPGWDPQAPPYPDWGPRGHLPPDWDPRGPPPPGWGRYPDDWVPPPDWERPPNWRGWGPEGPLEPWAPPGPLPPVPPPGLPPPGTVGMPPPDPAAVPPVPPPGCVPPFAFPPFPAPVWTSEPVAEEPMPNPPPDQPEWIKALISAPPDDPTSAEIKKDPEPPALTAAPDPAPAAPPTPADSPASRKTARAMGLLGKRRFSKPPPGRSTGIISFVGPTFGYIEREDLEKFQFNFNVFFGNPKALTPGVRVHFTACQEKGHAVATDVKVAPGGTEDVDPEIYEAVVSQAIEEPEPGQRQYPGQVYVTLGMVQTNLSFERKDSTVTLLKGDQVLINVLNDIITERRRATNIKPKIPTTFSSTREIREKGVIMSLKENEGVIKSEEHGELLFELRENLSDIDFTEEDVNEEVEFTVIMLRAGKRAIRIKRAKEPLLLTLCGASEETESAATAQDQASVCLDRPRPGAKIQLEPHMVLDSELYEGIVSQTIIEPKGNVPGYPGQIHANIGPLKTNVSFNHKACSVTLLKNDHVLMNLLINSKNNKRRAANIRPKIPFTFAYTKEIRELGTITSLGDEEGVISSADHGDIPFDTCENFSDTEFNPDDVGKEVEFTVMAGEPDKRAIRLRRVKRNKVAEDKILQEQKKREEEEKRNKEEEERRRKEQEKEEREAERKKVDVAAALAAAKEKWTPFGFRYTPPDSKYDISKERFEGTVLKAVSRVPPGALRQEVEKKGSAMDLKVKIKQEKIDEDEQVEEQQAEVLKAEQVEVKKEEVLKAEQVEELQAEVLKAEQVEVKKEEVLKAEQVEVKKEEVLKAERVEVKKEEDSGRETGRLVMTINGQQKQLPFGPNDLLTMATMLVGDKVRFSLATHRETKEEHATFVEILPDSFEESIEQRHHGIVIEFSEESGLIKCSENPQLFFRMSEVIERKKLELNEKVEFSIVPHEGGRQAIRIKRFTEKVFLPVRKIGGIGASKAKMTIKLSKPPEATETQKPEAEKMKAVVKSLRNDHSATRTRYRRSRSRSRSRSPSRTKDRSKSRSPSRDQFGRVVKKRSSSSRERDRSSSRHRRSRDRSYRSTRSRSRSHSRSPRRDRAKSKDGASKKRSRSSRERDEGHRKRRELSPSPRRGGVVDSELARKKRELEELNEMIAYKKSLVEFDPRTQEPGGRTCIDYDHGRITLPRPILKKRPEESEYHRPPFSDPYYDRPYGPYPGRHYGGPYSGPYAHPYSDGAYGDRPYDGRLYGEPPYGGAPSVSHRYTDRYDVYNEHYDEHFYDPAYRERPPDKPSRSADSRDPSPFSATSQNPNRSASPATQTAPTPSTFRPPSPIDSPPRSPSPKQRLGSPQQPPPAEKPPLDRFLAMLSKKVVAEKRSEPADDLLPHERALQDGEGFSRILGLPREPPSTALLHEVEDKQPSPKPPSAERADEGAEPYDKIQSLLRSIGLKLTSGEVSKLASQAKENRSKSSSAERESRPGSVETAPPPPPMRSSSLEPSSLEPSSLEPSIRPKPAGSPFEGFLDQQELKTLKKLQKLQSRSKAPESTPLAPSSPKPPPWASPCPLQASNPPP
ncbi:uncharacterized protein LOC119791943 isoform X3 [Cyprinodon tularosa]|uniref:uncharacterized protein LOC119791943 isoform X3 n=1 Tax=Cyprinodon tularosa TaxID=77115 RepID=UPI0018E27FCB|nr:uncharacterized protein LOC119791943 isoform X3 [Cyprinodon tularosa]